MKLTDPATTSSLPTNSNSPRAITPRSGLGLSAFAPDLIWEPIKIILVCLMLALCLLSNSRWSDLSGLVSLNLCSPETQWMMFLCIGCYFFLSAVWQFLLKEKKTAVALRPTVLLTVMLVMAALVYVLDYNVASHSVRPLIFIFSVAVGKATELWASSSGRSSQLKRFFLRITIPLIIILAGACFFNSESESAFQYRGQSRWTGLWADPNMYGLLMGIGITLTVSLFFATIQFQFMRLRHRGLHLMRLLVLATVTLFMGVGLLNSYSRGSWLGTMAGLAYIFFWTLRMPQFQNTSTGRWLKRNWLVLGLILVAGWVLASWQLKHSEQRLARRSFSASNANDTSWQNRVAAWKGAAQIMAENPWLGLGWNHSNQAYDHYYRPANIPDSVAITTNDYAMLGTIMGLPALICFLAYVGWRLTRDNGHLETSDATPDVTMTGWLQAGCRGAAIVLLVGFMFDGGLFALPTAAMFWILLELGGARMNSNRDNALQPSKQILSNKFTPLFAGVMLLLLGVLCWAKSSDPYRRIEITAKTAAHEKLTGIAVLPKISGPRPVIIYVHDDGDSWRRDGDVLRQFAELGFATVTFDYNQTNVAAFDDEFSAALNYIHRQPWADTQAVAWVGASFGAQNLLRYTLQHPDRQPQLQVRLAAGGLPEMDAPVSLAVLHSPFLMIHDAKDENVPVTDAQKLAGSLRASGVPVNLQIFPETTYGLAAERPGVIRLVGEYCKTKLTANHPLPDFYKPKSYPLLWCLLPGILWLGAWFWKTKEKKNVAPFELSPSWKKYEFALRVAAVVLVLIAVGQTAFHLFLPRLAITDKTMALAQRSLPMKWQEDYATLSAQPIWQGQKIKTLIDNVELSHYTVNELINWKVDADKYRDYVLSPVIAEDKTELNWRRELWDNFYRRVKKETNPDDAAQIVIRFLRERVTVATDYPKQPGVLSIWSAHLANTDDFEITYTAALRSVGIPARLTTGRKTEFWTGKEWKAAPRPLTVI